MDKKEKQEEIKKLQEIINWTLPGLQMYYRDTQLPKRIIEKYALGQIFRSATFVDVSDYAGKPSGNCRFIVATSKAAPIFKVNKATEKWKLHVVNCHSYFKVLDIFEERGVTQIFLLHIPAQGVALFRNLRLNLGGQNLEDQFIAKARKSLQQKSLMEVPPPLLEIEWIKRTEHPLGLDVQNEFFPLEVDKALPPRIKPLYQAIRKMTNDLGPLNEILGEYS